MIYTPSHFKIEDTELIIDFIKQNAFASIVSIDDNKIHKLTKIPLLIKVSNDSFFLEGHLALANPHWKYLSSNPEVTVMFDGPHGYISPLNYDNPEKGVPTWNYSSVLVKGEAVVIQDNDWLIKSVYELTDKYENGSTWKDGVDKNIINNLSRGIIGIKISVTSLEAKFKLSQHRSSIENQKVISAIKLSNPQLAEMMKLIST